MLLLKRIPFGCRKDALWLRSHLEGEACMPSGFLSGASTQGGRWADTLQASCNVQKHASQAYRNDVRVDARMRFVDDANTNDVRQSGQIPRHPGDTAGNGSLGLFNARSRKRLMLRASNREPAFSGMTTRQLACNR